MFHVFHGVFGPFIYGQIINKRAGGRALDCEALLKQLKHRTSLPFD
jgi:hypothetical protein